MEGGQEPCCWEDYRESDRENMGRGNGHVPLHAQLRLEARGPEPVWNIGAAKFPCRIPLAATWQLVLLVGLYGPSRSIKP